MNAHLQVLWLTPDKPANISVGRQRIADHLEADGFAVTLRGTTPYTLLQSLRDADEYDVVVGTTRAGAIAGALVKSVTGTPLVVDHVDPIQQFTDTHLRWLAVVVRLLENFAFHIADHVLYVYGEERNRVERYAKVMTKTDLGVEYERFADPDSEAVTAAQEHLEGQQLCENVAIYVGGLEPIYHIEELLTAMEYLDNWSLVILGDGSLHEQVLQADDARSNVHYLGTVPHEKVPGYVVLADVGVSLVDDPHTLKVLEYGATGLPIVQIEGRAVERFGDHLVYTESDPEEVAEAIQRAGLMDRDLLRGLVRQFDWQEITADYRRAITSVK
ncbi:glycosyltransferase [Halorarum halophilum]|uniref:glycosyltransferase n=1 Tax=Halorarum halophilum TaxID=2743090 RepID=UPI001C4EC619|nr:glycosyltransferase [Halobaculum halophilum]